MKKAPQFTDLTRLTKAVRVWYVISIAVCAELIVEDLRRYWMVNHPGQYQFTRSDVEWQRNIQDISLLLTLLTVILFLVWVFKSYRNAKSISPDATTSPAMAVVYYYIPFLSLYKPYKNMQEVWKICTSPTTWRSEKGSRLVVAWWWTFLLSSLFEVIASSAKPSGKELSLTSYRTYYLLGAFSEGFNAVSYGVAAVLVGKVWERMKSYAPESSS